jgi:hypothetical protein
MADLAISFPTGTESGLRNFRRWYNNYLATHNMAPPRHLVSSFLEGEVEANIARREKATALGLEKQRVNLAERNLTLTGDIARENLAMENRRTTLLEDAARKQTRAATAKGVTDIASLLYSARGDLIPEIKSGYKSVAGALSPAAESLAIQAGAQVSALGLPTAEMASALFGGAGGGITSASGAASAGAGGSSGLSGATAGGVSIGGALAGGAIGFGVSKLVEKVTGSSGAGGFAGGVAGGFAVAGPPGAIIGGLIGLLTSKCIIISACTGRDSEEVRIANKYSDKFLDFDQMLGYYGMSYYVAPVIHKHPGLKNFVRVQLVNKLCDYGLKKLWRRPKCKLSSYVVSKSFLGLCKLTGMTMFRWMEVRNGLARITG